MTRPFPLRGEITLYTQPSADGMMCHGALRDIDLDTVLWEGESADVDELRATLQALIDSAIASALAMAPYLNQG